MRIWAIAALLTLLCSAAEAADISGTWQGVFSLEVDTRIALKIARSGKDWNTTAFFPDYNNAVPVKDMALKGQAVTFHAGGAFDGRLSADGKTIAGNFYRGDFTAPLVLTRVVPNAAWTLPTQAKPDTTTHTKQFVTVDGGVKLDVLDYGGSGRPLIFLAGLGSTAHDLDSLAVHFVSSHHVYGITRRGLGDSDRPDPAIGDYSADRLGDDVLQVMAKLGIEKPVIAGHSLAGEELSSIATRHPEKVSGLVYLDAGYAYALYVPGNTVPLGSNLIIAGKSVRQDVAALKAVPGAMTALSAAMKDLQTSLPDLEKDVAATQKEIADGQALPALPDTPAMRILLAIENGEQRYSGSSVPILALYANITPSDKAPQAMKAFFARQNAAAATQANAFAAANPKAHVVKLDHARHAIWDSNMADVVREMTAFLDSLPTPKP